LQTGPVPYTCRDTDNRASYQAAHHTGQRAFHTGITKAEIRELLKEYGLPNWDRPASPCLSSRIPYGTPIRIESLKKVDAAEEYLKSFGLRNVRVRFHNEVARIEVDPDAFEILIQNNLIITERLKQIGFQYIAMDIIGFRSGSLNEALKNG